MSLKIRFQYAIFPDGTVYFNGTLKKDKISTIFRVLQPETTKESILVAPSIEISNQILKELGKLKKLTY